MALKVLGLLVLLGLLACGSGRKIDSCDALTKWTSTPSGSLTIDTSNKKEGTGSIEWKHATTNRTTFTGASGEDFSDSTAIQFWLYTSKQSSTAQIALQIFSENSGTTGPDYWFYKIPLNYVGWKQQVLRFNLFSKTRTPLGWGSITGLAFIIDQLDIVIDRTMVVNLDNLEVVNISPWCAISDDQFFNSFDYTTYPKLVPVKTEWDRNNRTGAVKLYANYLRTRTNVKWTFDPQNVPVKNPDADSWTEANDAVNGKYIVVEVPYQWPNGKVVNWTFNPTLNTPSYIDEWQHQFNRMPWFWDLGAAYSYNKNVSYIDTFVAQIQSFAYTVPRPCRAENAIAPSCWRTIECGIRSSGSWTEAFFRFLMAPQMTDEILFTYAKLFADNALQLWDYNTGGNWLTMEMNGLFTIGGAILPEFTAAPTWRKYAAQRLYDDMNIQILPDGSQYELSTGYQQVFLDNMIGLYEDAVLFGLLSDVPANYPEKLEIAYEYNAKMMQPDWKLPMLNDAWELTVTERCVQSSKIFTNNNLLKFCGKLPGAPTPSFKSIYLAESGHAVMRSGWTDKDNYAMLDVGPLGFNHVHQDSLNLVMSVYGRSMLWDNGGGYYEETKWRTYALSTFSHNTAVVDYLPQARNTAGMGAGNPATPSPVWQSNSGFDYIHGSYIDGYGTESNNIAQHHREVLHIKAPFPMFLVVDRFIPKDTKPHLYTVIWNCKTTSTSQDTRTKAVFSTDTGKSNIAIVPLSSSTTVTRRVAYTSGDLLWGWEITRDNVRRRNMTTVLHERNTTGTQYFATLVIPLTNVSTFSASDITSIVQNTPQSYSVQLNTDPATIEIKLNNNTAQGGLQINLGTSSSYTSPNYGSSGTSSSSSSSASASSTTRSTTSAPTTSGTSSSSTTKTTSSSGATSTTKSASTTDSPATSAASTQGSGTFGASTQGATTSAQSTTARSTTSQSTTSPPGTTGTTGSDQESVSSMLCVSMVTLMAVVALAL